MNAKRCLPVILALLATNASVLAALRLPSFISDGMVLQQEQPIKIRGWADAGQTVTVSVAGQSKQVTADSDGQWLATLDPLAAGTETPVLTVTAGAETKKINNILVGEVWLASGQSNMFMKLGQAANGKEEVAAADHPGIRFFVPESHAPGKPAEDCEGSWQTCSPQTAGKLSATAYYFARKLQEELKTPVGLIVAAQGATPAENWISRRALESEPALQPLLDKLDRTVFDPNGWDMQTITGLYNGEIYPFAPFALRGVIWYQGETNASRAAQYRVLFPALIKDWRQTWGVELPFYFVQLANHLSPSAEPGDAQWAQLREAQALTLSLPKTGMAVAIDIGEKKDIHPKNKRDVGWRLALQALAKTYGKDMVATGPVYQGMKVEVGGGLVAKGGALRQFAIAGANKIFVWADAEIDGDSVLVSSGKVPAPVAVRYAWANNPEGCNLYNKAGLPAAPFRTDDWPGIPDK